MFIDDWPYWPGKSASEEGAAEHPAALHMLDVAAVAERLIAPFDFSPPIADALNLLVALHDIGKLSDSFRAMLRDGRPQRFRHWERSEVMLHQNDASIAPRLQGHPLRRQSLYAAVAGHHGRPPSGDIGVIGGSGRPTMELRRALQEIGSGAQPARNLIEAMMQLWPNASLAALSKEEVARLSWWLPGLCAAADWIGSNTRWFVPCQPTTDLAGYLVRAREIAAIAVTEAGLAGAGLRDGRLFDFAPRPMQAACADIDLPDGPLLAIIEEETGAGKTEAALILAQRMLLAGKGRGLFFALPTMATADAMFSRAASVAGRLLRGPA